MLGASSAKPERSTSTPIGQRRQVPFSESEFGHIQKKLDSRLEPEHISYRPSATGMVAYLEGWKSFNLANEVFGFNGWSSEILEFTMDFCDDDNGKYSIGISCLVRVALRDGTFHDDIGYGLSENQKTKGAAYEKAKKEAVTDAMKRALRVFGNRLGNCAYDKVYLRELKNGMHQLPKVLPILQRTPTMPQNAIIQENKEPVQDNCKLERQPKPLMVSRPIFKTENINSEMQTPIHMARPSIEPPGYIPTWNHPCTAALPMSSETPVTTLISEDREFEDLISEANMFEFSSTATAVVTENQLAPTAILPTTEAGFQPSHAPIVSSKSSNGMSTPTAHYQQHHLSPSAAAGNPCSSSLRLAHQPSTFQPVQTPTSTPIGSALRAPFVANPFQPPRPPNNNHCRNNGFS